MKVNSLKFAQPINDNPKFGVSEDYKQYLKISNEVSNNINKILTDYYDRYTGLYLKSKDSPKVIPVFPDFLSRGIIYASSEIQEYKIIQKKQNEIEIYIDKKEEFEKVEKSLIQLFEKMNVEIPKINQLYSIKTDKLKKLKRIESEING